MQLIFLFIVSLFSQQSPNPIVNETAPNIESMKVIEASPTTIKETSKPPTQTIVEPKDVSNDLRNCTDTCSTTYENDKKTKCVALLSSGGTGLYAACLGRIDNEKEQCLQNCH
jgi:hypothetical protein